MGRNFTFGIASLVVILQFIAMSFLIIACVTAPVFEQIGLSEYNDVTYGIFGYCDSDGCSSAQADYDVSSLSSDGDWTMSNTARESLGKILLVAPIAAGLTFFAMVSNFFSQFTFFNAASGMFILNLLLSAIGFLSSALICIVVFLLFSPNTKWCAYILVPSAVLNLVSIPLVVLAHSQFTRGQDFNGDDGSVSIRENFYKDELGKDDLQRDLTSLNDGSLLEYYKTPQIVTSRTLNSTIPTLDEQKSQDIDSTSQTLQNQRNLNFSNPTFASNPTPDQPYSAIEDLSNSHASLTSKIRSSTKNVDKFREKSTDYSSLYEESNQGSINFTDKEERNDTNVTMVADASKSQQDILQDIINGALGDDEDEFMKQNTVDPSERPVGDFTDDDGIKDDDSQFTSVSQRGINPNYYQNRYHEPNNVPLPTNIALGPINPAQKYNTAFVHHTATPMPTNNVSPPQGLVQPYYPQQQASNVHYPPHMPQLQHQSQNYPIPASQPRPTYSSGPSTSDMLLQANPEFSVGRPGTNPGKRMYGGPKNVGTVGHYKPAYKRIPRQYNAPPASAMKDGLYGNI